MSGAWEKISDIISQVRNLDITPMAAINRIDDVLAEAAVKEAPLYPRPGLSHRASLILAGCALVFGLIIGWAARTHNTHDRYMSSLARQHEAAEAYYNSKLENIIAENKRSLKK
jgi:hypothetical protein